MNKEIKELISKVESLEWTVDKEGDNEYRLSKYSPAGQDFSIVVEGEEVEELIESIYQVYNDFDTSEETYLWLDNTGHGTNGAPYHMKDLLEDMEACEQMISDLYDELNK
ncbi:hypothetical protein CIL05_07085 [Virgibacillus profundi]|uniref:Uncharacterized protein n=2 Tax=Virgibacillus profundi TaxID=2024555 RepID=A0A2A2IG49_9BACI|nr:hypothetical protein CIL05_07085 [Virgibacillus profundi]PXY54396.1 hypothetical protein CIT14_07170 [Virgibacillus profundi]